MPDGGVLLLGCGPIGLAASRLMGQDRAFGRVITADSVAERAAAAAELCGGKAVSTRLDATDEESLARVMDDVSLVVNTLRLPLGSLLPLIRNVVDAGASYVDSGSDAEAIQAVFDSEYLEATTGYRSVGVVPGLGASPGLTNALTSYLGQRLERVDEARFYMVDDLRRRSLRQWRDRLAAFGSPALVWRVGEWRHVSPMSEFQDAEFPPPLGAIPCCTVGLGPVTLPGSIPSLTHVSSHRGFSDGAMDEMMRNLLRFGFGNDRPIDTPAGSLSPAGFAAAFFSGPHDTWDGSFSAALYGFGAAPGPVLRQAQVSGLLRGRKTCFTMTYHFPGEDDADNVAATLAVGARMLLTRELPAPGLHAPESLDPAPFLWDMERRGVEIRLTKTVED